MVSMTKKSKKKERDPITVSVGKKPPLGMMTFSGVNMSVTSEHRNEISFVMLQTFSLKKPHNYVINK